MTPILQPLRSRGVKVLQEIINCDRFSTSSHVDGLIVKGHEAGGVVGEETSFILLQKAIAASDLPVWVHGGIGLHSAAACFAVGAAGVVLDNQLLLTRESPIKRYLEPVLKNLVGTETVALESREKNHYFRVLDRPGFMTVKTLRKEAGTLAPQVLIERCHAACGWEEMGRELLPLGQDAAFAASLAARFRTVGGIMAAVQRSARSSLEMAERHDVFNQNTPLAKSLGTRYPIVQGPMTRVSDSAAFAAAVAKGGALPMLAMALLKGPQVEKLLRETVKLAEGHPWGIGLLGFAPSKLLKEQVAASKPYKPSFVLIAGGRPDQALAFEKEGIPGYLHVPSPRLLDMFMEQGARRFVFEGRECGGHIGPLSSFVLWDSMVDQLLARASDEKIAKQTEVLFAGGIHDRYSAAMVGAIAAPLVERGIKVGVLMGTAYLFTKEIVQSGALVEDFQAQAVRCDRTVSLESGTGHATRCAFSPFAEQFIATKRQLEGEGMDPDRIREQLEEMSLGRLRIASKGQERRAKDGKLVNVEPGKQRDLGQYMIGQVSILRHELTSVAELHREVSEAASSVIGERAAEVRRGQEVSDMEPSDIAIIGIGAAMPKAHNARAFWQNILDGLDAITEIPQHRWDWRLYFDEARTAKDKIYSRWGGFLDDMAFDPVQYGMPPNTVKSVDPLQLMALEVVRQTLGDAGYVGREFDGERTSVIFGTSGGAGDVGMQYGLRSELPRFYGELPENVSSRLPTWTEDSFAGILLNVVAGRVANRFNFGGVNFTVDAACASSLAAIYQAVVELEDRRSDMVIAGGVDTMQGPFGYLCFSKTQALSPNGRCRTFDKNSDGIVISEGIAMVALKRLEDAERDGDRIYAVIKGVGGSSDGRARGLTAPLPEGQLRALNRAYAKAGYSPKSVSLFEAHGTGTVAGDTAELETMTRILHEVGADPQQSVVGSVKTMIGHTKAAAGVAGLIKTTLALYHKVLPGHANVITPNHRLRSPDSPLYLIRDPKPWIASKQNPRRASVSAFGFGGTNFHATLEEYRGAYLAEDRRVARDSWSAEVFVWNRHSGLAGELESLIRALDEGAKPVLRDLAYTLYKRWDSRALSVAVVATNLDQFKELVEKLTTHLSGRQGELPEGVYVAEEPLGTAGKVAALFPGQGSQYPDMLRELGILFPEIMDLLSEADDIYASTSEQRPDGPVRLSPVIFPPGRYEPDDEKRARAALMRTDVAQPALGAIEAGLWEFMCRCLGFTAHMTAGHSYGEYAALYAAGCLEFSDLIRLSEARGRFIMQAANGADLGAMAAVQAERKQVERIASEFPGLQVANHNAPTQSILAGSSDVIDAVVTKLTEKGYSASRLPVAAAFHSPFVEPASKALEKFMAGIHIKEAAMPVYSNTTASAHPTDAAGIRANLVEQLSQPVEFVAEIEAMYQAGARVFVEIGPKGVLSRLVRLILEGRPHLSIAVEGADDGLIGLLHAIASLTANGVPLDLGGLYAGRDCREISLDDLAGSSREQMPPAHAWMLNGSGARRVGEPVREIGVTLEQVATRSTTTEQQDVRGAETVVHVVSRDTEVDESSNVRAPVIAREYSRRGNMLISHDNFPEGGGDRGHVLESYFETMRQFLHAQADVMTTYLDTSAQGRRRALPARTLSAVPQHTEQALARTQTKMASQSAATVPFRQSAILDQPQPPVAAAPAPASMPETAQADITGASTKASPRAQTAKPATGDVTANKGNGKVNGFTRHSLVERVLTIVEDRTGYPRDMIGMDQNMEADLGIDSIKRVEIAGALVKELPADVLDRLGNDRDQINTQKTLGGIVDLIAGKALAGGESRPFDQTGVGTRQQASAHLPRFIMRAHPEPLEKVRLESVKTGTYLITADGNGVSERVAALLESQGSKAVILSEETLAADPAVLERVTAEVRDDLAGLIHLAPLGEQPLGWNEGLDAFKTRVERNEKSLYRLIRNLTEPLERGAVIAVSGLGGYFARKGNSGGFPGLRVQGGAVGLVKSLREEWQGVRAKAVDVDPDQTSEAIAEQVLKELRLPGGRLEVGYPCGVRHVFHTEAAPFSEAVALDPAADWVVIATGGARGITAEVLNGLASAGLTLILTGRTPFPDDEPQDIAGLRTNDMLRNHFITKAREHGTKVTPVTIQRQIDAVLRDREIRDNVRDFENAGARVVYKVVDVRSEEEMAGLFNEVYERFGRLDGIIHGAGVIEDKAIKDKTPESWSRVVDTKVDGLFLIGRHARADLLKFLIVFGSVAGRYGNSGQSDYATANELMNRLACQLHSRWRGRVKIGVLNWGPWAATRYGKGMVTPETERKFAEKGVTLVSPEVGQQLFLGEIMNGSVDQVEIVDGEGPWDSWETEIGAVRSASSLDETSGESSRTSPGYPMLTEAQVETGPKGEQILYHTFKLSRDLYLDHHRIDGTPVVPAAVALELMAEVAAQLWPGWYVNRISDLRLLKGISLAGDQDVTVAVVGQASAHGDATGFDVAMELRSTGDVPLPYYRAVVHLATTPQESSKFQSVLNTIKTKSSPINNRQAYDQYLFHGPRFHVITQIKDLGRKGALTSVKPTYPGGWIVGAGASPGWLFDPGIIDSAPQMNAVWSCITHDEFALPNRIGRVTRFNRTMPEQCQMHYLVYPDSANHRITADVAFVDSEGHLVLLMEEVEGTSNTALNRLRGRAASTAKSSL